jgi:hypothetical protein
MARQTGNIHTRPGVNHCWFVEVVPQPFDVVYIPMEERKCSDSLGVGLIIAL